jgi:hypothetical protein
MSRCPVPPEVRDILVGALSNVYDEDASVERSIAMLTDEARMVLRRTQYPADAHDCAIWFLEHHG